MACDSDLKIIDKSIENCTKIHSDLLTLKSKLEEENCYISSELPAVVIRNSAKIFDCMSSIITTIPDFEPTVIREAVIQSFNEENFGISLAKEGWIRLFLPPAISTNNKKINVHGAKNRARFLELISGFKEGLPEKIRTKYPLENAVLVFKQVLDKDQNRVTDHDNIESKNIANALCGANLIADDSPDCLEIFHCSVRSNFSALIVYLLPQNDLFDWLKTTKNIPEKEGYK